MSSPLAEKCQTFSEIAHKFLENMTPRNSYLRAARKEFATLVTKLSPKIHVFCFYEEQPINLAEMLHQLQSQTRNILWHRLKLPSIDWDANTCPCVQATSFYQGLERGRNQHNGVTREQREDRDAGLVKTLTSLRHNAIAFGLEYWSRIRCHEDQVGGSDGE
ncbi:hypothetical protein GE21DRAFT_1333620 [Neurospora crassa]|nr:hypothetical protein GE21DRAFT_1333620 [Neurospora crassa]